LEKTLQNLHALIQNSEATVTHDLLPTITMDETQLIQVFQNLIGNAIKYGRAEPPQVHVLPPGTGTTNGSFPCATPVPQGGCDPPNLERSTENYRGTMTFEVQELMNEEISRRAVSHGQ
jgi:light-regulated signal transduction histidine kinase (bacteriophytochrome)